jgi:Na+-translocating ferredoxin:NAD+ oxidoreductase RnfG subunit
MIDKWKQYAGLALALLALAGAALSGAKWLIAQEAKKHMAPVEQKVEQTNERLDAILQQQRQQQDWDRTVYCLEKQHQDETAEERERICREESEARWKAWALEDSLKEKPDH